MGSGRGGESNMKNNNNNNNNVVGNNNSNQMIPTSSKKMIQNLKEIVNCPEAEIYAMLKDCNMDPNEAVNRLLSQDPFHEVKSKREKKKETKDGGDLRSRGNSSSSTRGGRGGADRYSGRSTTTQFGSSEFAASRGKPAYKKDYGSPAYTNTAVGSAGNNMNRRRTAVSDVSTDRAIPVNTADGILGTPQPSSFQSAWSGVAGQVSMADIVKMGKPHGKTSSNLNYTQQQVNNQYMGPSAGVSLPHESLQSQYNAAKVSEVNQESGFSGSQHVPPNDDWPLDEEPPIVGVSSAVEPNVDSEQYDHHYDRTNQQFSSLADDVRYEEDDTAVDEHDSLGGSVPGPNQNMQENNTVHASAFDNDMYQNSFPVHRQEVEDLSVSTVTDNFQTLSLPKEDEDTRSEEEGPAVKIPDHLQVQSAECSHLSFGSFGSGINAPFSGSFTSRAVGNNEEEASVGADTPSMAHSEARNSEYYGEEHLRPTSDVSNTHNMGAATFDAPSVSQSDMLKQEAPEAVQVNQYPFSSAAANYSFENSQQLNSSFAHSPTSSQMQGLSSLAGVMAYSNSLPSALLAPNAQTLRESELAYSPFPISQSAAVKYGNNVSSISGPNASVTEALKTGNFPAAQPTQTPPGGGISGGNTLPQHLAVHPYSQHSVPLGPLNMMGYPFLPQSYTYMPSAFQQAFAAGNSTYPQSLAAVLPQYKNSVSVSGLPQSASVPSGYGAFGNSNNIPNNFPLNPPSAPAGTSMNYEDVLSSQYKDASHLLSLQQGPGSRTMSGVPGSTYYSFQGQTQQPTGFRQSQQQPSQHYGPLSGYPNFYHSQAGLSLEHQQQMARDGSLGGSQGQQAKQTQQQLWQNSY